MAGDLYDVIVNNVADTDEEVDAAGERAKARGVGDTARAATSADDVVLRASRQKLIASLLGLGSQTGVSADQVRAEAAALKRQDPRSIPAVSKIDVARRRAAKLEAKGKG